MESSITYFGIDVVKSGSKLGDFVYSVAVMKENTLLRVEEVTVSRLVRMLWEFRPVVLAVDNVLELGGSIKNLLKFLKLIPPETKLVQVNIDEKGLKDLRIAARNAGLEIPRGKIDSGLSATVIATLASRGFGKEIGVFSKKVKIYVHSGRSGRAGGASASRFKRNLRAAVAQVVKNIEEALRSESIEYDVSLRRSRGGIESAVFTVYCDMERLYGLVRSLRGHDVVVRIKPVVNLASIKQTISPSEQSRGYLIVGLDPGIEVGIAALDLSGRVITVRSGRGLDRDDVVSILKSLGRVVVVATDKHPPPEFVKKVAAALSARLYTPERSLDVREKEAMVREYAEMQGINIKNTHIRDALASAIAAYRSVESKLRELEEKLGEIGLEGKSIDLNKYKAKLIDGESIATIIEDIIEESLNETDSAERVLWVVQEARALAETNEAMKKKIKELEELVESLEEERRKLQTRVKHLEEELSRLRHILDIELSNISKNVVRERKVYELMLRLLNVVRDLDNVRSEYEKIKEQYYQLLSLLPEVASGRLLIVRKISSARELRSLDTLRHGELVYIENPTLEDLESVRDVIEEYRIGVILPSTTPNEVVDRLIYDTLVPAIKDCDLGAISKIAIVKAEASSRIREVSERVLEIKKIKEQGRRSLTMREIESIIEEYRKSRELQEDVP